MKQHDYRGLDADSAITLEISMRDLVERVVDLNRGTHRFLSHLVDVLRERRDADEARYRAQGDNDVADYVKRGGSPIAEGIAELLEKGLWR